MINTVVETFDGSMANKRDCRFIKGDFYIKNKQCFLIGGTWYRINSGFITFDHETQNWVITKDNQQLIKGIVGYDVDHSEAIIGSFTTNPYRNVPVVLPNGSTYTCISEDILPSEFKEDVHNMRFVHPNYTKPSLSIPNANFSNNAYPFQLPYCAKHYEPVLYKSFLDKAQGSNINTSNIAKHIAAIGNFSFGFEFETTKGKIPNYRILNTGLLPLRDGSITGVEFATIPLSGKAGASILENACNNLKKYTTFSENESLHLHIGNIPTSKKFIGALYTVCCLLEKDVYSLFPQYYAQTSKFKARGKDYNMPLRRELVAMTSEETFDNLAFYLSEGKKYQGFGANHPSDPEGAHKWQINARYHWINYIPLLFGDNKTIEFRCHVPTRDPIKVFNWLYICSAIIKYTEQLVKNNTNLDSCRNLTLQEVVTKVYSYDLSLYLRNYITERQSNRNKDDMRGDFIGNTEISNELKGIQMYSDIKSK